MRRSAASPPKRFSIFSKRIPVGEKPGDVTGRPLSQWRQAEMTSGL
jgi:hypothetical protein